MAGTHAAAGAPRIADDYFTDLLYRARFPVTPHNLYAVQEMVGILFGIKALEFIDGLGRPGDRDRFLLDAGYPEPLGIPTWPQRILDALVDWNPRSVPHIQDFPEHYGQLLLDGAAQPGRFFSTDPQRPLPLASDWQKAPLRSPSPPRLPVRPIDVDPPGARSARFDTSRAGAVGTPGDAPQSTPVSPRASSTMRLVTIGAIVLALLAIGLAVAVGYVNRGPGAPDSVGDQVVAALNARDSKGLDAVGCIDQRTGRPLATLSPAVLQLVVQASSDGPTALVTDFSARKPATLVLRTPGTPQSQNLPSEVVLEVESHHWCLAGLAQRTS